MYNVKNLKTSLVVISMLSSLFVTSSVFAKGGVPSREQYEFPAQCSADSPTKSYIYKAKHGNYHFGISVAGAGATGNWEFNWSVNGQSRGLTYSTYTTGWVVFGASASDSVYDGTTVTYAVVATNKTTGEVCDATVAWQF